MSLPGSLRAPPAPLSPPPYSASTAGYAVRLRQVVGRLLASERWPLEWQHSLLHVRRTDVRSVSLPDLNLASKPLLETDRFRGNQVGTAGFLLTCLFGFFFPCSAEAPKSCFYGEVKSTPSTCTFSHALPDFHKQLSLQSSLQKKKEKRKGVGWGWGGVNPG